MFSQYYIDKAPSSNGSFEIHVDTCMNLPVFVNRTYLGFFGSYQEAKAAALKHHAEVCACPLCCE